jgi:hypothetical protein
MMDSESKIARKPTKDGKHNFVPHDFVFEVFHTDDRLPKNDTFLVRRHHSSTANFSMRYPGSPEYVGHRILSVRPRSQTKNSFRHTSHG